MRLEAGAGVELTEIRSGDAEALLRWLAEEDVVIWTGVIPMPYTMADALKYVDNAAKREAAAGRPTDFAIREAGGLLIGGAGLHGWAPGKREAEVGYWLAKPYWGRGIAKAAVAALIAHGSAAGIETFTARIYAGNDRSARLAERLGFVNEGLRHPRPEDRGRKLDYWYYVLRTPRLL